MTKKIMNLQAGSLRTLAMALLLTAGFAAQAQEGNNMHHNGVADGAKSISFPASNIQFWTGQGTNQAVVIVGWDDNTNACGNFALAWGVRWNGSATAQNMLDTIMAYDSRFSYGISSGFVNNVSYNDGTLISGSTLSYWCYNVNNQMAGTYPTQAMADGDVMEISSSCNFSLSTAAAATNPNASDEVTSDTITADEITYWVGEGPFNIVFVVNWPDTALAWGYHFSARSTNLQQVMNAIAAADNRVRFVSGTYGIDDILFIENGDTLHKAPYSWWEHTLNGHQSSGLSQQLNAGDFSRWADPTAGVVVDSTYDTAWGGYWTYTYAYPQEIYPVSDPVVQDATIGVDDIRYWVGEGDNRVVFAVNWVDTALAWGYRYGSTATVLDAMNAIAAADSRFSYTTGAYGIDDILFVENGDTLRKAAGSWWEHTLNGTQSMGAYQPLTDGDFSRWADPMAGVLVDSLYDTAWGGYWTYIYAYPRPITPVDNPGGPEVGPFCGAVGTEGCTAIKFDDHSILDWARACTIVRGSSNLSDPAAATVTYGTEADAVGAVTGNNMEVVSLGDGGSATLTFARPIANGEGYDFAVFENSFNDSFLELAFVEVSTDGETFVRFPATSLTQTDVQIGGMGSVDPTFINNLAGKYRVGYGTPFDLEELRDSTGIDINNINFVRIVDVVGSIDPALGTRDAFGHMINDPFPTISNSAGFDLDGVAVMHQNYSGIDAVAASALRLSPNPADSRVVLTAESDGEAVVYDMTGRRVLTVHIEGGHAEVSTAALPAGVYMLRMGGETLKLAVKH